MSWIIYEISHLELIHIQCAELIGAYHERLPHGARERTLILNTLEAWSNIRLAHKTDWIEHNAPLHERQIRKAADALGAATTAYGEFLENCE